MKSILVAGVLAISFVIAPVSGNSQTDTSQSDGQSRTLSEGFAISLVPQTFFKSGFRVDVAYFFANSSQSLVITPAIYEGDIGGRGNNLNDPRLSGFGAELVHKIYFLNQEALKKQIDDTERIIYLGHGPFYRNFTVEYGRDGSAGETRDINKYGYSLMFGLTLLTEFNLYLDAYVGGGIRRSSYSTSDNSATGRRKIYDRSLIDYEFEGVLPVSGLKLGVKF